MFTRAGLRVLMYHKVLPRESSALSVTEETFQKQIGYLEKNGYSFLNISQVLEHVEHKVAFPQKAVLITFDDGYTSNTDFAFPYLLEKKIRPTLFIPTQYMGESSHWDKNSAEIMSSDLLSTWSKKGIDIGFHSHFHQKYTDLSLQEIEIDIQQGLQKFREYHLSMVPAMAYPYGACPHKDPMRMQQVEHILKKNDFKTAFRIGNRVNPSADNPFLLQRIDLRGDKPWWWFVWSVEVGRLF